MPAQSHDQAKLQPNAQPDKNADTRYVAPSVLEEARLTAVTGSAKATNVGA